MNKDRPLCSRCGMEGGFISNLPVYGLWLGYKCYIKSIHPVRRVIDILRYQFRYEQETGRNYPVLP